MPKLLLASPSQCRQVTDVMGFLIATLQVPASTSGSATVSESVVSRHDADVGM